MILKRIIFLCLVASNVLVAQNEQFSLSGKTSDFEDGTYLYIRDLVNQGDMDSAVVRNNKFHFATILPEPSYFVMIYTKDKANFTELWLEDRPMTFDASNGDFSNANITGSRNHIVATKMNDIYVNVSKISQDVLKQREKDFIKQHSSSLVSAYVLNMAIKRMTQIEIAALFSQLSEEIQTSSLGERITKYLEKDLPEIGERYSNFSVPNVEGEIVKISDLRGKVTLLQFWSSTCGYSREINATLVDVYSKYKSKGLEIISISKDTNGEEWIEAIQRDELNWNHLSELKSWEGKGFKIYGIHSTPSNFLINDEGIIVARNLRGDELEKRIKELLTE